MDAGLAEKLAGNLYFDPIVGAEAVKVLPGEYFVTEKDMLLVTVLGSCVSACIRDQENGIGGMNHFMLPDSGTRVPDLVPARYGAYAMEILIDNMLKLGARRGRLAAKVFGGGRVMDTLPSVSVGEQNCRFALDFLRNAGIPVLAQDLLDVYPRKVYFFPATGRVLVKTLRRLHNDTLQRREVEYAARLGAAPVSGAIELFQGNP